jgi:multiple sugar transport system permease protein
MFTRMAEDNELYPQRTRDISRLARTVTRKVMTYLAVAVIVGFFGFPIYWTVLTSIKPVDLISQVPPVFIFKPTLEYYRQIFAQPTFWNSFLNSTIVASTSTVLAVALGAPVAYALARFKFRGSEKIAFFFLSTRMTPPVAVVLPFFLIARSLGLLDSKLILIIAYTTFNMGFVVWLLRGFFSEIPCEIDEAAMVDGCGRGAAFLKVVLPLAAPGIAAAAIICFIFCWNEFLFALILTNFEAKTLPVAAAGFVTDRLVLWGNLCATAVITYIPVAAFALIARRHLIRGLTMGGVK